MASSPTEPSWPGDEDVTVLQGAHRARQHEQAAPRRTSARRPTRMTSPVHRNETTPAIQVDSTPCDLTGAAESSVDTPRAGRQDGSERPRPRSETAEALPGGRGKAVVQAEPPTVIVEVRIVDGEEGAALRVAQARVIREVLLWATDQEHDLTER